MTRPSFFLFLILASALGGCESIGTQGGTDVGNPDVKSESGAIAARFSRAVCATLNFCYSGFNRTACLDASSQVAGVGVLLGYAPALTLQDIDDAISGGQAELIPSEERRCLERINSIRCTALPLDEIWISRRPTDYRGLRKFWMEMRDVCGQVVRAL